MSGHHPERAEASRERHAPASHGHHPSHGHSHAPAPAGAVTDPVCGMSVDPHAGKPTAVHAGRTYHFCSARCRERFIADPERYLSAEAAGAAPVPEGTIYTCPMHPEVRQVGPGTCPICGMALEPELPTADTGPNPELVDMTRRLWIGLALTLPVFALEMGSHLTDLHMWLDSQALQLDPTGAGDAGGAVGGVAVFRARLGLHSHRQSQHVHADCHGHRRGLGLQRRRHAAPQPVSLPPSAPWTAPCPSISRPPPSSRCWCCWARCSN